MARRMNIGAAKSPRHCRWPLAVAVPLLLASAVAAADEWADLREAVQQIRSSQAEFVQTKHMKILARPLVSKGRFYFRAPTSVRWEYASPLRAITLVHNDKLSRFVWSRQRGRFVEDSSTNIEAMRVVMQQIAGWLSGRFEDKAFKAALKPGPTATVVLTPKDQVLLGFIKGVQIQFSTRPGVVQSVRITENEGTATVITFNNVVLNAKLDDRLFEKAD